MELPQRDARLEALRSMKAELLPTPNYVNGGGKVFHVGGSTT